MESTNKKMNVTPPLLSGGEMDAPGVLRVSRKRNRHATLRTAQKFIQKYGRVDMRSMGAAISRNVELANQLVEESHDTLIVHVRTYSVPINVAMPCGHFSDANMSTSSSQQTLGKVASTKTNTKYNSAISIVVIDEHWKSRNTGTK